MRKDYVDTRLVDILVEQAIQISLGLGAGRPNIGIAILADTFANNPWTKESTAKALQILKEGERKVENNPGLPPWKALYAKEHRLASHGNDIPWKQLDDVVLLTVWAVVFAQGIFWGLAHEKDMLGVFAKDKADYERTATHAIPHGLAVSEKYPWISLGHFYKNCEELVQDFESVRPPLAKIPDAFRTALEIDMHRTFSKD